MSFPQSSAELTALIVQKKSSIADFDGKMGALKAGQQKRQELMKILEGLMKSWRWPDPGKYFDSFFFLSAVAGEYGHERVVIRNFLPEGTMICATNEEWAEFIRSKGHRDPWEYRGPYEAVPPRYKAVTFNEILKARCSSCGNNQPVVEHYVQTEDGPDGDAWYRGKLVLCLDCEMAVILKGETRDHRF